MLSTADSCLSERFLSGFIWSNCAKPRIEFMGVRNSWLMDDKNSDFAMLAFLAASRSTTASA